MKNLLLAVLAMFSIIQVSAQMTVTGTVANDEGEPLIGVNIHEKGTIKGTF
jgi:iron complex outermembrane recepter protein